MVDRAPRVAAEHEARFACMRASRGGGGAGQIEHLQQVVAALREGETRGRVGRKMYTFSDGAIESDLGEERGRVGRPLLVIGERDSRRLGAGVAAAGDHYQIAGVAIRKPKERVARARKSQGDEQSNARGCYKKESTARRRS